MKRKYIYNLVALLIGVAVVVGVYFTTQHAMNQHNNAIKTEQKEENKKLTDSEIKEKQNDGYGNYSDNLKQIVNYSSLSQGKSIAQQNDYLIKARSLTVDKKEMKQRNTIINYMDLSFQKNIMSNVENLQGEQATPGQFAALKAQIDGFGALSSKEKASWGTEINAVSQSVQNDLNKGKVSGD